MAGVYTFIALKTKGLDLYHILEELIKTNECVIVPGFGGFETQYQSASVDMGKGVLVPPTKHIVFRPDYVKGQGVMQQELMRMVGFTPEKADEAVARFVLELKARLEEKGKIALPGIGMLKGSRPGNCIFIPEKDENFLADSFGLDKVELPQTSKGQPHVPDTKLEPLFKKQPIVQKRPSTKAFILLGSFVVLTLLTLTYVMSEYYGISVFPFSLFPDKDADRVIVIGPSASTEAKNVEEEDENVAFIEQQLLSSTQAKKALLYTDEQAGTHSLPAEYSYHLVAGSFRTHENAEILKNNLTDKGFGSLIFQNGGYYRVVVASFDDKNKAINELRRLRSQLDQSLWLLTE